MKRILFVLLFFTVLGFENTGNACEELRKYPELYERTLRTNSKGLEAIMGELTLIAITPINNSQTTTYLFLKSEIPGEKDIYFLQETNKDCTVTDQSFYMDWYEVKRIIKQKGMREL